METTEHKPIAEQVSERMVSALKAGYSVFQKPIKEDSTAPFLMPYNPKSGYNYSGPTALILAMKNRPDPRWMTSDQAWNNRTSVIKGSRGTLFQYLKTREYVPVVDKDGNQQMKANGKPKQEPRKLDPPVLTDGFLFNGDQLKNMPDWKQAIADRNALQPDTLAERVEKILENSKPSFGWAGDAAFYDPGKDKIMIPDKSEFQSENQYFATVLHEMSHWAGHEDRLNLGFGAEPGSAEFAKEELRTNIASLLIGAELNLTNDYGDHKGFHEVWAQLMEKDPNELFNAAADAQQIAWYVLDFQKERELKQDVEVSQEALPEKLIKGEVIPYNDSHYEVVKELANNNFKMKIQETKETFKMGPDDNIYASLMNARNNSQEQAISHGLDPALGELSEKENRSYSQTR